jgi:hypothetical protein
MDIISPFVLIGLLNATTHFLLAWSFVRIIELILAWCRKPQAAKAPENPPQSVATGCPEALPAERP